MVSFASVSSLLFNVPFSKNNKNIFQALDFLGPLKLYIDYGLRRSMSGPPFRDIFMITYNLYHKILTVLDF